MTTIQPATVNPYSVYQGQSQPLESTIQSGQASEQRFPEDDQVIISVQGQTAFQESSITPDPGGAPPTPDPEPPGT